VTLRNRLIRRVFVASDESVNQLCSDNESGRGRVRTLSVETIRSFSHASSISSRLCHCL